MAAILKGYCKQTFSRDTAQWLRCVVKYASDAGLFADSSTPDQLMLLLAEVDLDDHLLNVRCSIASLPTITRIYCK